MLAPFTLANFQESPAYQFNLQQGMEAINKQAAARGMRYAPATLRDLGQFAQGTASNEFMNAYNMYNQNQANIWNRLSQVSGMGQQAAAGLGAAGLGVGQQIGSNIMGAGNAIAAGQIGQANAFQGGLGGVYNAYLMSQIMRPQGGGIPANSPAWP